MSKKWHGEWAGVWLLCAIACGGDDAGSSPEGEGTEETPECVSGTSYSCFNPRENCQGLQICSNGRRSPCECPGGGGTPTPGAPGDTDGSFDNPGTREDSGMPAGSSDAGMMTGSGGSKPPDPPPDPPRTENCSNGEDDDGDREIDCDDRDCSARSCVEGAPTGWTGPAVLYAGVSAPPACGGGYASEALSGGIGVTAPAAACSTCTCTPSDPGCASYLNVSASMQSDCGGTTCGASSAASCAEVSVPCLGSAASAYVTANLPSGAPSCSPSTQTPNVTTASFAQRVRACAPATALVRGGCDDGEVCAGEPPFTGPLCIVQSGDHSCPPGPYSVRSLAYTTITDTRTCSACACDHDCTYEYEIYDAGSDLTCATALLTEPAGSGCPLVSPSAGKVRIGVSITGTGACAQSGGAPTGSAEGAGAVTICCEP